MPFIRLYVLILVLIVTLALALPTEDAGQLVPKSVPTDGGDTSSLITIHHTTINTTAAALETSLQKRYPAARPQNVCPQGSKFYGSNCDDLDSNARAFWIFCYFGRDDNQLAQEWFPHSDSCLDGEICAEATTTEIGDSGTTEILDIAFCVSKARFIDMAIKSQITGKFSPFPLTSEITDRKHTLSMVVAGPEGETLFNAPSLTIQAWQPSCDQGPDPTDCGIKHNGDPVECTDCNSLFLELPPRTNHVNYRVGGPLTSSNYHLYVTLLVA